MMKMVKGMKGPTREEGNDKRSPVPWRALSLRVSEAASSGWADADEGGGLTAAE